MPDLSDYFARRTYQHILEIAGKSRVTFRNGVFGYNSEYPSSLQVWKDYEIRFVDKGRTIDVVLNSHRKPFSNAAKRLSDLRVSRDYKEIFDDIAVRSEESHLVFEVQAVPKKNSSGRTQNEDKLFYALYQSVVKPILSFLFEIESRK
ncbi:MAG: hypothetical protein AABX73_04030 [Nanoarchaeota archaeon]